jgi:outer membrane autotransporter protein
VRGINWNANPSRGDLTGIQMNALAGITRRIGADVAVGMLAGYEIFNYSSLQINGRLQGEGWTAGAYLGWRAMPGLRFDAATAYSGVSYNAAAGTASGVFQGSRLFVTSGLTGTYRLAPDLDLEPSARVYALWEKESAFTDSLGVTQAERTFATGRASVGAKLIYRWQWSETLLLTPFAGAFGDYNFSTDDAATAVVTPYTLQGVSARVVAGLAVATSYGAKFAASGEVGGLGGGQFTSWTLRARADVPF